jgi:DNA primase
MQEENLLLLGALENILGKGHRRARGNFAFHCPFCNHYKPKLEIDLITNEKGENPWECWVCQTKGRTIRSLLRHLHVTREEAENVLQYVQDGEAPTEISKNMIRLPDEYQSMYLAPTNSLEANRFRGYLYNRGLTNDDFIKYSIGYCTSGKYKDRVIVPSYDSNNVLNYFVARSVGDTFNKYLNPVVAKDNIICFENLINWNESIILCEGVFDGLMLRNAVPLLGKQISSALMKKILENPVPEIYLVLDKDAKKAALKWCEVFLNMGKKVYFVELPGKDPSEMGRLKTLEVLQQVKELTFSNLVRYKLELGC